MNYIIGLLFIGYIQYWVVFYIQIIRYQRDNNSVDPSGDIIVCLKNEDHNISALVQKLSPQKSEVIYVDDFSTDKTKDRLKALNCVVYTPDVDRSGKKAAISKGIQSSTSDYVLFTDADCEMSINWSQSMLENSNDKDIILGYGPMKKIKGLIPLFSRYETYHTALQYFSYTLGGHAYMGVGRNMMIRRSSALSAIPHLMDSDLASGDDDMMVNYLATKNNVGVNLDKETFVYSNPEQTFKAFIRQKSRHISTSTTYKRKHQFLLGFYSFTFLGFYTSLFLGLFLGMISFKMFCFWLVLKWSIQSIVNLKWMKKLDEFDLWWKFPLLDLMMYFYLVILSPYLVFKNKNHWN